MQERNYTAFQYVFETPTFEASVRGLILQRYLIQQLENANGVALRARRYNSKHMLGRSLAMAVLVRRQMRKVEWHGNSVPQMTLSRSEDLLLVPLSPNYPGVDFLIWVAQKKGVVSVSGDALLSIATLEQLLGV
jgi:hypothetical protein